MALAVAIMKEDCTVNKALNLMGVHITHNKKRPYKKVQIKISSIQIYKEMGEQSSGTIKN